MFNRARVHIFLLCIMSFGFLTFFSCGARNGQAVSPTVMNKGGEAHVVSFVDDVEFILERIGGYKEVSQRELMEEIKKKRKKTPKKKEEHSDLKELKTYKKEYKKTSHDETLVSLKPNDEIINSFIIEFRKRQSQFNLKPNMKLSEQKVLGGGKSRRKDFKKYKSYLSKAKLVFDLRVNEIRISQYKPSEDPDTSGGFFSTWVVSVKARGYLYDLNTGKILWRSKTIESWSDTTVLLYGVLLKGQADQLRRTFSRVINNAGQRLAISFFRG